MEKGPKQLLEECARKLLDAVDMMNDGPDESDQAYAQGRLMEAYEAAREWRRIDREEKASEVPTVP